jgi:mxaC protein
MSLAFDHSWLLLLCLLAVPALRAGRAAWQPFPSLIDVPRDAAGSSVDALLRLLAAAAIVATVLGLAGLHRSRHSIERHGNGAHIVLVLDRSLSMDEGFATVGHTATETKTAAAARLIDAFFASRPQDSFGIIAFSTAPIQALPITDDRAAAAAALRAMRQKALANTDIGGGLRAALAMFAHDDAAATRVVLLVSDGAGYIQEATQDAIRAEAVRERVHLYYLYLRAGDEPPLLEAATTDATHPAALDAFFRSLRVPYRGFEAADTQSVRRATDAIGALETRPLTWLETVGRLDYAWLCYAIAAACLVPLLLARAAERPLGAVRQLRWETAE